MGHGNHDPALTASPSPRVFDLVLFSDADKELVPLRIAEMRDAAHLIVFAETDYLFSTGKPKNRSAFDPAWLALAPNVRNFTIKAYPGLEGCARETLIKNQKKHKEWKRLFNRHGMMQAKCQESFGRNALLAAFRAYGGQPNDVALISDADEIPRAAAMPKVVSMATRAGRKRWPVSLGAVHHFKYSVGCERGWRKVHPGATWLKGPTATTGAFLSELGAQPVRTMDGCVEVASPGVTARCEIPTRRQAIANASWHLSSVSGGLHGTLRKMNDNAANVLYRLPSLFHPNHVLSRALDCRHGEKATTHAAKDYWHTPWNRDNVPRYPDVPRSLEAAFRRGELDHFLGWRTQTNLSTGETRFVERPSPSAEMSSPQVSWDPSPSIGTIEEVTNIKPWEFRLVLGSCNRTSCANKIT